MSNKLSAEYSRAAELHNKIMVSAQLAQTNLWDMCSGLKEMRDSKLYKELGYQNFEDYCQTEHGISRQQVHKYIAIVEKVNRENVNPGLHFGVRKLYLLSTLSESEQEKITSENDVEDMTVRELENQIKILKGENKTLTQNIESKKRQVQSLQSRLDDTGNALRDTAAEKLQLQDKVDKLEDEVSELRSRPIEAVVTEESDDVRQLKETIKNLELSTERQLDQLQDEHLRDVQTIHKQHAEELENALKAQKQSYVHQIEELERKIDEDGSDTKVVRSLFDNIKKDALNRFESLALFTYNHSRDIASLRDEVFTFIEEEQEFLNSLYGGRE